MTIEAWTPSNILALLAVIVTLYGLIRGVSKDAFADLKDVVEGLKEENERLRQRVTVLEIENSRLRVENDQLRSNTQPHDSGRGFARR